MESMVHTYLSKEYSVTFNKLSGVYFIKDKNTNGFKFKLVCEITKVFGISEEQAKLFVISWVETNFPNIDLDEYWHISHKSLAELMESEASTLLRNSLHIS